jgi:hypothetical protein
MVGNFPRECVVVERKRKRRVGLAKSMVGTRRAQLEGTLTSVISEAVPSNGDRRSLRRAWNKRRIKTALMASAMEVALRAVLERVCRVKERS